MVLRRGPRGALVVALLATTLFAIPLVSAVTTADAAKAPVCTGATYTVVSGDSWSRISQRLKVGMTALLAANGATIATVIVPGRVLCLPAGATPPTTAPATTAPATTAPAGGAVAIRQFPVQGQCWFADTWRAPRSGGRLHEGVDIIAKAGLNIYAVDDGTISKQVWDSPGSLSGNAWRLLRADGTYFFYAHLSAFAPGLKVGSTVKAGQIIGYVGMTGNAGSPHLHFEVHPKGGAAVNPYPTVKAVDGCSVTAVPAQPGGTAPTPPASTAPPATTPPATTPPATTPPATTPPVAAGSMWQFVAPVLAFDSGGRKLAAGQTTTVRVDALSGVAAGTSGVMVRLSVRNIANRGNVAVHSCASGANGTTSLNFMPGRLSATTTEVAVTNGTICLTASTAVDVRMDVVGYLASDGVGLQPIVAKRALDTRSGTAIPANGTKSASLKAMGVPAGSKAATVTVTLLAAAAAGSIGIGACGGTPWILPFQAVPTQVFSAVVRTNDSGVCVSATSSVHVVLDVTGAWTGTTVLSTAAPARLFDSRSTGALTTQVVRVPVSVPGATRAQFTVSVITAGLPGAVFMWNCGEPQPAASVVSTNADSIASATVSLNMTGGSVCMASTGSLHSVVDLVAAG
ncbi:MAG: peptidoglycan DD-metalloendopeptidase family protein [Actinobacteria bacterium]|nr:peptidoglycan DD-metalloendopeptidase family protein [Actinomycetota bacterium]